MTENELIKIWQSSPNQERVKFERSRLMLEVQAGIDRLDKMIRYRDVMETIGAGIVIPGFIAAAYLIPFIITKIASILIVFYAIYVLVRLRKARKHEQAGLTGSYLDYLHQEKKHLEMQKHLQETVLYWYVLPGHICVTLFTLGFGWTPFIVKMQVMGIVMGITVYFLNKRAVKNTIVPRLQKLKELIKVMENR